MAEDFPHDESFPDSEEPACPQFTAPTPSALCSLLMQDVLLTGMIRNLLMTHFYSASYIQDSALKEVLWKDSDDTGILIETIHRWLPQMTELRPALLVKRNDYDNVQLGQGDRGQFPAADDYGHPHYETFWSGSHTIFCIAKSGNQAEILGTEVQRELTQFGPLIREYCSLHRFRVLKRGAIGKLEEAREHFVVPVVVGCIYAERWVIRKNAPTLKPPSLSILAEC